MPELIEMRDVDVDFGNFKALRSVTLSIEAGSRRGLIGPNGAGKTTLLNALAGQVTPTVGTVSLNGTDISNWSPARRNLAGIGRTFQISNLLLELTVLENMHLALGSRVRGVQCWFRPLHSFHAVCERADALMERWKLTGASNTLVGNLSYGQQRVLEVVLAMAGEPGLLLLDEPTAGLSAAEAEDMVEFMRDLHNSVTLVIVEHDIEIVKMVATEITALVDGEILLTAKPAEALADQRLIDVYLGTAPS